MREKPTKTYFGRVLAFMLAISMMVCTLYGCNGDSDVEDTGGQTTESTAEPTKEPDEGQSSEEASSSDESEQSSGKDESKTTTKKPTNSKTTTKKTSSKTTKKTSSKTTKAPPRTTTTKPTTTKSNTYYAPQVYSNSAPGTLVYTDGAGTTIDYSNTASGYIMFNYSGIYSNIRVQVKGPNGVTQTYPVFTRGTYEAIPLTGGSGTYNILLAGNNDGSTSYVVVTQTTINAALSYSTAPYIRPNINCNYNSSTSCVQYAAQLTRGCDTDIAKIEAIYKYVVNNIRYDHGKASSVKSSAYIPNLNSTWSTKTGICYDYAAVMAAMLRTQGIPTKVVAGNVSGSTYHAWISAYVQGVGWIDNIIYFNGNTWKLMDPTFASTGGIGTDWSNKYSYAVRYTY